jgi:hypothetical protein
VAYVVECLASKHESLSSNPSTAKKKPKGWEGSSDIVIQENRVKTQREKITVQVRELGADLALATLRRNHATKTFNLTFQPPEPSVVLCYSNSRKPVHTVLTSQGWRRPQGPCDILCAHPSNQGRHLGLHRLRTLPKDTN